MGTDSIDDTITHDPSRRNLPKFEVGAVVVTGLVHLFLTQFGAKGLSVFFASVFWLGYIRWRVRGDARLWVQWGFHGKNLWPTFAWPTGIFVVGVSAMAWYGLVNGRVLWQGHLVLLLLLYPLWGILQQFLVQALGVANLMTLFPRQGVKVALPVGVLLFSLVHYPDGWLLMLGAGVMACFFIRG